MFVPPLPHDGYIDAVVHRVTSLGHEPTQWWTTTPDGEQLDGVIFFDTANPDLWTGKVWLGWDQRAGWALCDDTRNMYSLQLATFANPEVVATCAADRLVGRPDTFFGENWSEDGEHWDGAEALIEAVREWENNG